MCKNETKCVVVVYIFPRLKRSLFLVIGPETSRHFLKQSGAKMRQSASWLFTFSRVWSALCSFLLVQKPLAIFSNIQVQKWNKVRFGCLRLPAFEALSAPCKLSKAIPNYFRWCKPLFWLLAKDYFGFGFFDTQKNTAPVALIITKHSARNRKNLTVPTQ